MRNNFLFSAEDVQAINRRFMAQKPNGLVADHADVQLGSDIASLVIRALGNKLVINYSPEELNDFFEASRKLTQGR